METIDMDFQTLENSTFFAALQDSVDPLQHFRSRFVIPKDESKEIIYFCGNSLGLQPKSAMDFLKSDMNIWANRVVEGYFEGKSAWINCQDRVSRQLANVVGALPEEVCAMNTLTVNIHLLFVSFYRPTPTRYKILCESNLFPSDKYALKSQILMHNLSVEDALVMVEPRAGTDLLSMEDIISAIEKHGTSIATLFIGAINYYSGQYFDLEKITRIAHKYGIVVGFDFAHAVGNVKLNLHDWNVDFGCFCTYKYLNSGPAGIGAIFIHERQIKNQSLLRLSGWFGHCLDERFDIDKDFRPILGARGWEVSCTPILLISCLHASLNIFEEAGMDAICRKSRKLTDYLQFIVEEVNQTFQKRNGRAALKIITPTDPKQRGSQLSLFIIENGNKVFHKLQKNGVIVDWREPNVIRVAPAPLYNTFTEVQKFGQILLEALS